MMSDTFYTIARPSEGLYKEKGSKFISFAHPVKEESEVKELLKEYKKRFFDARHVCYAYVLGHDRTLFRSNDDGEPSGTAGKPILGQIHSLKLTNVLVVVVRYFGGVLLGTGGLVVAYKEAAADALANAGIVQQIVEEQMVVSFDFVLMNEVMRIVKELGARIVRQDFQTNYILEISIRMDDFPLLKAKIAHVIGVTIEE